MDELSALKAISGQHSTANVVMVSAVNQKVKLREYLAEVAVDFVVKPFDPHGLKSFFERYRQDA